VKVDSNISVEHFQHAHPLLSDPGESRLLPHMPQLDGVRALAVLLVIWHHFLPASAAIPGGPSWGAIGVGMFFTLSGFLITRILLNCKLKIERREASYGQMLKQFYARRVLRIFPLYYAVLLLLYVFNPTHVRDRIGWHLAYLSNIRFSYWPKGKPGHGEIERHFWSLSVEEQFYIFWPLVILFAPRKLLLPLMVLVVASAPIYRYVTVTPGLLIHEWMMFSCLDLLGMGAILALLSLPQFGWHKWWDAFVETIGVIGVPLFICYVALNSITTPTHQHPKTGRWFYEREGFEWEGGAIYVVTALFAVWLIGSAAKGFKGPFGWFLRCPPIVYIGRISYGLYVIHMFVPTMLEHLAPSLKLTDDKNWKYFFSCTAISIVLASISWFAFEAPINRLKRYFEYDAGKAS
jgi:peptidoglycan/LPS O-acetylase OafA/YrhL